MPVVKDLVPDLTALLRAVRLDRAVAEVDAAQPPTRERLQSPEERAKLDGL